MNFTKNILFPCFILFWSLPSFSQIYYVSNRGDDSNDGSTFRTPLKTINSLVAKRPGHGSIINLERGSVWHESLYLNLDTSATWRDSTIYKLADNVIVQAYGTGDKPILDASDFMDENWTMHQDGANSRVYYRQIDIGIKADMQKPGVWDNLAISPNFTHLRKQTSISDVNNILGSFFYSNGVLYISTYNGQAPRNNQISVAVRNEALLIGNNAQVYGITTKRNLYNDGSLIVGINSIVKDCDVLDGSKHNMLIGSGLVEDCNVTGQGHVDDYGGIYSAIGFFFQKNIAAAATIRRVKSSYLWGGTNANATLLTAHANKGGVFTAINLDQVEATGFGGIYGNSPLKVVQSNSSFINCRGVVGGGIDTIISVNNRFIQTQTSNWEFNGPYEFFSSKTNLISTNDLFYGSPNTGQGFISVREGGVGSVVDVRNARFIFTDISVAEAMIRFDCAGKLKMSGSVASGLSSSTFCLVTVPGMTYDLANNFYPEGNFFIIGGGYTNFDDWIKITAEKNSKTIKSIQPLLGYDTDTGPWLIKLLGEDIAVIKVNAGIFSPSFKSTPMSYSGTVSYDTRSVAVSPAMEALSAVIKVNNVVLNNGTISSPVPLQVGINTISVVVTAQDNTIKTYLIKLTRLSNNTNLSNNANLSNLIFSSGDISPTFDASVLFYSAPVSNLVTKLNVVATLEDPAASVKINDMPIISGILWPITLRTGLSEITILVTAQDKTVKIYTVKLKPFADNFVFSSYPNPAIGSFNIQANFKNSTTGNIKVSIVNSLGSIISVHYIPISGTSIKTPVPDSYLEPGIYNIVLEINGQRVQNKLIISNN